MAPGSAGVELTCSGSRTFLRLGLVFTACLSRHSPSVFILLYSTSMLLDGVDGWLARRLGQTSSFGAWLDVVVDNLSRGMLWSSVSEWGWLMSALEWSVFVCNHNRGGEWKSSFSTSPRLVRAIMANGFRSPLGMWVVCGLHGLPVWLYAHQRGLLTLCAWTRAAGTLLLAAGRVLALCAEVWCIWTHIQQLCRDEPLKKQT